MKKFVFGLLLASTLMVSLGAQADVDTYRCEGKNLSLEMRLDWFGKGFTETIKGIYNGKDLAFTIDKNFRHPTKIDPDHKYTFYKDLHSETIVRMVNPDLAGLADMYYVGTLLIENQTVEFTCLNPTY